MGFRTRGSRDQVLEYSKHLGIEAREDGGYYYLTKDGEAIGSAFGNVNTLELLMMYKRRMEGMKVKL